MAQSRARARRAWSTDSTASTSAVVRSSCSTVAVAPSAMGSCVPGGRRRCWVARRAPRRVMTPAASTAPTPKLVRTGQGSSSPWSSGAAAACPVGAAEVGWADGAAAGGAGADGAAGAGWAGVDPTGVDGIRRRGGGVGAGVLGVAGVVVSGCGRCRVQPTSMRSGSVRWAPPGWLIAWEAAAISGYRRASPRVSSAISERVSPRCTV